MHIRPIWFWKSTTQSVCPGERYIYIYTLDCWPYLIGPSFLYWSSKTRLRLASFCRISRVFLLQTNRLLEKYLIYSNNILIYEIFYLELTPLKRRTLYRIAAKGVWIHTVFQRLNEKNNDQQIQSQDISQNVFILSWLEIYNATYAEIYRKWHILVTNPLKTDHIQRNFINHENV